METFHKVASNFVTLHQTIWYYIKAD